MIIVESYLLSFVLPLWIAAGFADWALHRKTQIERTSGLKESVLHILQMIEVGVPALMAIFLHINAAVIACMILAFLLHEATPLWDVRYANGLRYVSPLEQHVHSFLEVLPLIAGTLVISLHMGQFLSLFGIGHVPPEFFFELKTLPLSGDYLVAIALSIVIFVWVPYLEEFVRCHQFLRQHSATDQ